MKIKETDIVIAGSGVAGLICALELPEEKKITLITEKRLEDSNSYLAQGGISISLGPEDREDYIEDTLKAGHYKNSREAVEILVDESIEAAEDLISYGVEFTKEDGKYRRTKEGGHSRFRIMHYHDQTGKAIMEGLIKQVKKRENIEILENCKMTDLISKDNLCLGLIAEKDNETFAINSIYTVLATGGIGGIYHNTTSFPHIRGDAIVLAAKHGVDLKDMSYVQIHPTILYEEKKGRRFLISESVRGEGAKLKNHQGKRFVDELLPRDIVSKKIREEMKKDGSEFEWLDCKEEQVDFKERFPGIHDKLQEIGIDPKKDPVPIAPGQHYTMGGIKVTMNSETSMKNLYAAGEAACTGVHGQNRLASNSLLECVVFGKRAAAAIKTKNCSLVKVTEDLKAEQELSDEKKSEIIKERMLCDAAEKTE